MTIAFKMLYACLLSSDVSIISDTPQAWLDRREKKAHTFITDYYKDSGVLPPVELFAEKFDLTEKITGRPGYYYRELKDRYVVSQLNLHLPVYMRRLSEDPQKVLTDLQTELAQLKLGSHKATDTGYSTDASKRFSLYEERSAVKGVTYLSSGIDAFNTTFYGYRKADLVTIAGRSGVGKTWLIIFMAVVLEDFLIEAGITDRPILFVSNEMPADEIIERVDCIKFGLPYEDFMRGSLTRSQKKNYKEGLETLKTLPGILRFVDNCQSVDEYAMLVEIYGPCISFIDGSYMFNADEQEGWEKITYITRNLKRISKSKSVPIVNTTQLKRGTGRKESIMGIYAQDDFAYSSSYTADSDIALRMYQLPEMLLDSQVGIEVAKGRRVKPGTKYIFTNNLTDMKLSVKIDEPEIVEKSSVIW